VTDTTHDIDDDDLQVTYRGQLYRPSPSSRTCALTAARRGVGKPLSRVRRGLHHHNDATAQAAPAQPALSGASAAGVASA
jgi:hypothetical protein